MGVPWFTALQNHGYFRPFPDLNQMLFKRGNRQQRRNGQMRGIQSAIRQDEEFDSLAAG